MALDNEADILAIMARPPTELDVLAMMAGRVERIAAATGIARRRLRKIRLGQVRMGWSEGVRIVLACRRLEQD